MDLPPPPYFGSYRQLAAPRSNPLISSITWQVMAVSGFPSPSLISANLCQHLLDLRISPPSPNLCYILAAPGSSRQSLPFPSFLALTLALFGCLTCTSLMGVGVVKGCEGMDQWRCNEVTCDGVMDIRYIGIEIAAPISSSLIPSSLS